MQRPFNDWHKLIDVWRSGQIGLPEVRRWAKYAKPGPDGSDHGGVRPQDSLQHSYSITLLGSIVLHYVRLSTNRKIDGELLLKALLLHDHGEGELGLDTLYVDKNVEGDVREYVAFVKRFNSLDPNLFHDLHTAFLLQFATRDLSAFPEEAHPIMLHLRETRPLEILLFDAVERWDYILYAVEQLRDNNNRCIVVQVLRNQMPHMDQLADSIPGLREYIWTDAIRKECTTLLEEHAHQWPERRGG